MSDGIDRRSVLQSLLALPAGMALTPEARERAARHVAEATRPAEPGAAPAAYEPKWFASDEWALVRMLADYVIPRDARSGSATDAGVPEFMDFFLGEYPSNRTWMKDGLAWINAESRARFGTGFVSATDAQRRQILDDIAYPKKAPAALKAGVTFFTRFRDFTASGFWSSKIGMDDLGYIGNRPNFDWEGTPAHVQKHFGF